MKKFLFPCLLLSGALLVTSPAAHAGTDTGSTIVSLDADAIVDLTVSTSLTFSPTAADYAAGSVEKVGANGISVTMSSNSSTGATVAVRGTAGSSLPTANISVKESNAGKYLQLTDVDQEIFNRQEAMLFGTPFSFNVDVKISDLATFNDEPFSNTLVFTATTNAGGGDGPPA